MSDHPSRSNDNPEGEPPVSGWRQPSTPGTWRQPEQPQEVGWRVPALPTNLDASPAKEGDWHLPAPDDTTFGPDDETEILRPEDMLDIGVVPEPAARPEDVLAPEDLMFLIENPEDDEDDFETLQMSELIALASLAEDEAETEVIQGAGSLISEALVAAQPEDAASTTPDEDKYSPAERAMMAKTAADAADPAEYARRQLAELGIGSDDAAASAPSDEAVTDAAEYARRQLEQLGATGYGAAMTQDTPLPQATQPFDPRKQELARRFLDTQEQVRALRQMAQTGNISQEDFLTQLRNLMIRDDDQVWWIMGVETDTWYRAEGNDWVTDTPSVLLDYQRASQGGAAGLDINRVVQDSLPYLPDSSSMPVSEYSAPRQQAPQYGAQIDEFPIPEPVPRTDPDYTVPNPRVYDATSLNDPYATVPSSGFSGPTVMARPVEYGSVEAPYDTTEPPDFDALDAEGEIYEEAVERQRQSTMRIIALVAAAFIGLMLLAGAGIIIAALLWYNGIVGEWEAQIAALENFQPEFQTVVILDNRGNEIGTLGREGDDRRVVSLGEISPFMIHAVVSIENERFFEDPGWDFFAILRAFYQNFVAGNIESGASTITQQVARNFVLQSTDASASRKLNEIIVAGELTRRYSKNFILELYLNEVGFGNQAYGVEAAAQFYFGVSAADLNMAQSALLAGLIQSPALNEPVNNRQTSFAIMRNVMNRMAQVGCLQFQHAPYTGQPFCVDQAYRNSDEVILQTALVEAADYLPRQFGVDYPHFIQLVQAQLENYFGSTEIYRGGFIVRTTLDSNLQDVAQQALINQVNALATNGVNTGSVMVTDPRTCSILAMIGSPDFNNPNIDGQVNGALTYQQPGSSIKPILYVAALQGVDRNGNGFIDQGEYYTPATILWDVPTTYATTPPYSPRNFDRQTRGPVSMRSALQNSYNIPAVKTYEFLGTDAFVRTANAMGLRFRDDAIFGLTTGVGSTEVRLYDMMTAYGTIANNGRRCETVSSNGTRTRLRAIESITDSNGNPIAIPANQENIQAIPQSIAYLMQNILSDDQARAQQFGLNSQLTLAGLLPTQEWVGAKSGTSDGNRDLWTMGFTSNRVVGVWLGRNDDGEIVNVTSHGSAGAIWNAVMRAALQGTSPAQFAAPTDGSVIRGQVCATTGTLPTENCPTVRNELYLANQPPQSGDQGFVVTLNIDSWTGQRANENCPDNVVTATFANITDPFAVSWLNDTAPGQAYANQIGLPRPVQIAPSQACTLNTPIPVARLSAPGGGQTVQGVVQIRGQVSADGFNRFQLEYANLAQPDVFFPITGPFTQQQPAADSNIATWDTLGVPNGAYVIRLAVFSNTGGFLYRTVQPVTVNNPAPAPTPVPAPTLPTAPIEGTPLPFDPVVPDTGPTPTVDTLGG